MVMCGKMGGMNRQNSWQKTYEHETQRGEQARQDGNEGMARVCARRAAGVVIKEYLRRQGIILPASSVGALQHIKYMSAFDEAPTNVREAASHFQLQLTKEHKLPGDVDLLADVRWLKKNLLDELK